MSMSMLASVSARAELLILPVVSIGGKLVCAACLEHGRESVLLIVRIRHRLYALCPVPGCRVGISRDQVMWRPVHGCKGWTEKVWVVVDKKEMPGQAASHLDEQLSKNGRATQWARERLKALIPPEEVHPHSKSKGRRTKGIRGGIRPKRQKHRHRNHR
jgi:hypothetical protein